MLGAGALSDPRVMQASEKVIPILVDCTQPGANQSLLTTYQVRGFPTLLFVASDGEALGRPGSRDAVALVQLIDQLAQNPGGSGGKTSALVILAAIAIAVPCILVLVYKKWFAGGAEDEA